MDALSRFLIATATFIAMSCLLEVIRRQPQYPVPWWLTHGPGLGWAAVALVPWAIALRQGYWPVPGGPRTVVALALPATYRYTLFAFVGLSAGVAPFTVVGLRRKQHCTPCLSAKVSPPRAAIVILPLLFMYIQSRGSSPSSLWILSNHPGANLYADSRDSSFMSLSLIILVGIAIAYLACQPRPGAVGLALYFSLIVLALGSAHRYLVVILLLTYLILNNPLRRIRVTYIHRLIFLLSLAAAVWLVGFAGLGQISTLRSGVQGHTSSTYISKTISSFDVIGPAEYIFESGVTAGELKESSYFDLPAELVPRAVLTNRTIPPATALEASVFGPIGESAPLWLEGVLNSGVPGEIFSMILLATAWSMVLGWAAASRRQIARIATAMGPVWILFIYQSLSRILILATIDLFGSIVIGLVLWTWIQGKYQPTTFLPHKSTHAEWRRPALNVRYHS